MGRQGDWPQTPTRSADSRKRGDRRQICGGRFLHLPIADDPPPLALILFPRDDTFVVRLAQGRELLADAHVGALTGRPTAAGRQQGDEANRQCDR